MILWWCYILVEIFSLAKFEHFCGKMSKLPLIELKMVAQIISILMVWNTIVCQRKSKRSNFEIALLFVIEIATFNSHTMAGKQQIFIRIAILYYTNWVFCKNFIVVVVQWPIHHVLLVSISFTPMFTFWIWTNRKHISCGWIR